MPANPLVLLSQLVVPIACPGCGRWDVAWCEPCATPFLSANLDPRRVEAQAGRLDRLNGSPPLPVWAVTTYAGPSRDLVVHWKDRKRCDLDKLFAPAMAGLVGAYASQRSDALGPSQRSDALGPAQQTHPLLIVPAPSNPASAKARGRAHLDPLAKAVAATFVELGWQAKVARLVCQRRSRDQVGQGARARGGANIKTKPRAVRRIHEAGQPRRALLLDDVLTTGATLAGAQLALEQAGIEVVGAFVLAATPPPGRRVRALHLTTGA